MANDFPLETGAGWAKDKQVTRQRNGDALELMNMLVNYLGSR